MSEIDSEVINTFKAWGFNGVASIIKNGKNVYMTTFGLADNDSPCCLFLSQDSVHRTHVESCISGSNGFYRDKPLFLNN